MSDPNPRITVERLLDILKNGQIAEEHGVMRWSSNYTFLLSITHDDLTVMAVYKPQRGERPLWDFPDGTLCYREVASFITSDALGWQIVPPTVLRDGPHGIGSVQFFIDHDPEENYFAFDESMIPQLQRLAAFDYLVNNADRKGGHCLLDRDRHLWGIDHGLTFNTAHKLRTVVWDFAGEQVPEALLADISRLCERVDNTDSDYYRALRKLLEPDEIQAFQTRIQRLLKQRRYPKPGPGPNYPWPPV